MPDIFIKEENDPTLQNVILSYEKVNIYLSSKVQMLQLVIHFTSKN